jgi:hypothetical protein
MIASIKRALHELEFDFSLKVIENAAHLQTCHSLARL